MKFIRRIFLCIVLIAMVMQVGCVTMRDEHDRRYVKHLKAQNARLGLEQDEIDRRR